MQDAEKDSFVPSDYDELDLMSDSNIENTSDSDSDSGGIIVIEILLHQTNLITIGQFEVMLEIDLILPDNLDYKLA